MKKILLILFIYSSINVYSQSFPNNKPDVLIGKKVTPITLEERLKKYGYKNFVSEFDTINKEIKVIGRKNKPFYVENTASSDYYKLKPLIFIVDKVYELNEKKSYKTYNDYILQLKNDEIGIVYYRYDPTNSNIFELELINNALLPNEVYCNEIKIKKDKFEDIETHITPFNIDGISFLKSISNNKKDYFINIRVNGSTLNVGEKGVYILLENGKKILKPNEKIDVDVNKNSTGWEYSAFINLNNEEITLLKSSRITDVKLFIYEKEISLKNGLLTQEYLKCITK